jgi:hypothetical protein
MLRHSTIVLEWPVQQWQCSIITYSFRICTNFLINSSNLPGSYEVILGANENPEQPFKELNVVYQMMWFNSLFGCGRLVRRDRCEEVSRQYLDWIIHYVCFGGFSSI